MEYRFLPHGGDKISVIGLGSGSITGTEQEIVDIINTAIEKGINYFDMAPSVQSERRGKDPPFGFFLP